MRVSLLLLSLRTTAKLGTGLLTFVERSVSRMLYNNTKYGNFVPSDLVVVECLCCFPRSESQFYCKRGKNYDLSFFLKKTCIIYTEEMYKMEGGEGGMQGGKKKEL